MEQYDDEATIEDGNASKQSSQEGTVQPRHRPKLGHYIYLLVFVAVMGGFLFGYDTGVVSAAMMYVEKDADLKEHWSNIWHECIVSVTPAMAGVGALFAGKASDVFGRKKIVMLSTILFTVGGFICAIGIELWVLLVGRLVLGLAIGLASMVVPIYVGESSPAYIRGQLITGFQFMITFGLVAANILAGAFSYFEPEKVGWRLMLGFASVPSIVQFVGFLFLPESPRWLYKHESHEQAEKVLKRIYNNDEEWIQFELAEYEAALVQQKHDERQHGSNFVLVRVFTTPSVRKALFIGCSLQAFQQMSGINTIMYYTGAIIKSAGVKDTQKTIWISCGTAGVNFLATFIPMFLIERIGRRLLLLVSVLGVFFTLLMMGGAFLVINMNSKPVLQSLPEDINQNQLLSNAEKGAVTRCASMSNCDFCTTKEECGYCSPEGEPGWCLPVNGSLSLVGDCRVDNLTAQSGEKMEWNDTMCRTDYTFLPILVMVLFLCAFAVGYAPLPWVLNAEFYPLWARGTCVSLSTVCNWAFNVAISASFLTLGHAATKFGTFFIYAGMTAVALVLFYFVVPETRGLNLDEVQLLFMTEDERQQAAATQALSKAVGTATPAAIGTAPPEAAGTASTQRSGQ